MKIVALKIPMFEWQGTEATLLKAIEADGVPFRLTDGKECYEFQSAQKSRNEELKEDFCAAIYKHYGTATSVFQANRFKQGYEPEVHC